MTVSNMCKLKTLIILVFVMISKVSPTNPGNCTQCDNGRKCYTSLEHCDNMNACGDWSDEKNCSPANPPKVLKAEQRYYKGICIKWRLIQTNKPSQRHLIINTTTLLDIFKLENATKKFVKTVIHRDGLEDFIYFEEIALQNGTTYLIELRTKTRAGISVNATSVNVTIPRMVAPSKPRNISIKIRNKSSLTLVYNRPSDDGGTNFLNGSVKKCRAESEDLKTIFECTKYNINFGNNSQGNYSFHNLKSDTRYYFSVYFRSIVNQEGPEAYLFYKTPSDSGLSTGAVVGIVIACVVVLCVVAFIVYKIHKRTKSRPIDDPKAHVAYQQAKDTKK